MEELKDRVEGKIKKSFSINYFNTEENNVVYEAFQLFCENETNGGYLKGIKKLLESYSTDWKYETLFNDIKDLRLEIENIKEQPNQETKEQSKRSIKTFGGNKNE